MTIVNTNGELRDLETLLGVAFESGDIYTFQVENACTLKVGNYDECLINSTTPFTYEADGTGLQIRTNGTCNFKVISKKTN